MVGIIAVLVLVTVSVIVTKIGATALRATGVSEDLARFQARSAFTGVGYTTDEAESIANHSVRRRIILTLMLFGNAGIVSVIASLVLGFSAEGTSGMLRLGLLVAGLALLWLATSTSFASRVIERLIVRVLRRWTDLEVLDYVQLLDLAGDYAVRDLRVREGDWLADTTLEGLDLTAEGVLVLGIRRVDGDFIGAPTADTPIEPGDTVLLYGREKILDQLDIRPHGPSGDADHATGVQRHQRVQAAEQARDRHGRALRDRSGDEP